MTDEREVLGPHEARDQPTYEFHRGDTPAPPTPLQQFVRDLEAAGHVEFAARLSILLEHDPHVLPQIPVSPPVPEPTLPETAMVELTERVAVDEEGLA